MFRSFDAGRTVTSPMPLHLAIVGTETSCMFCLEGDRYTRRGDFRLLADRRLGIVTPSGEFAAKNSPVIPDNVTRLRIHSNGQITFNEASGVVAEAGRIELVRFDSMEHLTTDDGVFFSCNSGGVPQVVPPTESVLLVGQLELSNVNQSDEQELLKIFQATQR
jgi:flagellar basal body rod protein FlgG